MVGIYCWLNSISNLALAGGTVTICAQSSLETALAGGGNVNFACGGVIVLTTTISITADTVLDGTGQSVTISGNDSVRLFNVASNVSFSLINLTLAHGSDLGAPGDARSPGGNGYGGALFIDGGVLHATQCQFSTNRASGGTGTGGLNAGDAYGGAIYTRAGSVDFTNCTFISNQTAGGRVHPLFGSGRGGAGMGGAIYNEGGRLLSIGTHFLANAAQGGVTDSSGGSDGPAFGGAVYSTNGTLSLENCILSTNATIVGPVQRDSAPGGAAGGAIYTAGGSVSLVTCVISYNQCQGDGGWGSTEGNGGSLFNTGELAVSNCTFLGNGAIGGTGTVASEAGNGGAIYNSSHAMIVGTTFHGNTALGGRGNFSFTGGHAGANGNGGGVYSTGSVALLNCTFFHNLALGGDGQTAAGLPLTDGGPGSGGAVYLSGGSMAATNLTFAQNLARGGSGGVAGGIMASNGAAQGGAIYVSAGAAVIVANTILADSLSAGNCFGTLADGGHNISSDATCNFTAAGSLNSTDPKLGPFGSYGGLTPTVPLLSGSPAIDAGDSAACPAVDQRGVSRPYGAGCDIGAFEFASPYTINGHVRGYGSPAGGVVNVASNSLPVDASGFYTFTGLAPGTYLVTPTAAETRFVPGRRVVQVGPDSTDNDFDAYQLNALTVETSTTRDFQIVFAGEIEATYRTESSTNLSDWSPYSTNRTDTNGVYVITNLYSESGNSTFLRVIKP